MIPLLLSLILPVMLFDLSTSVKHHLNAGVEIWALLGGLSDA
jgi:hypothetical protein